MRTWITIILIAISTACFGQFNPAKYWNVGSIYAADPDLGDEEIVWSITSGNTSGRFVILPCSGLVRVDTLAYDSFITQKTFTLTFKVSDPEGNYVKTTRKVLLKKINGIKQTPVMWKP